MNPLATKTTSQTSQDSQKSLETSRAITQSQLQLNKQRANQILSSVLFQLEANSSQPRKVIRVIEVD